jgi:D-lactate dehydrogenase (cytochrome)
LEEKPTLFLEFHSSETGLDDQTSVVSDIAHDNGGSDFQFAKQVTGPFLCTC